MEAYRSCSAPKVAVPMLLWLLHPECVGSFASFPPPPLFSSPPPPPPPPPPRWGPFLTMHHCVQRSDTLLPCVVSRTIHWFGVISITIAMCMYSQAYGITASIQRGSNVHPSDRGVVSCVDLRELLLPSRFSVLAMQLLRGNLGSQSTCS